jgi:hypothetical protein
LNEIQQLKLQTSWGTTNHKVNMAGYLRYLLRTRVVDDVNRTNFKVCWEPSLTACPAARRWLVEQDRSRSRMWCSVCCLLPARSSQHLDHTGGGAGRGSCGD